MMVDIFPVFVPDSVHEKTSRLIGSIIGWNRESFGNLFNDVVIRMEACVGWLCEKWKTGSRFPGWTIGAHYICSFGLRS